MSGWRPIHENHAIDVMAAVVTFAQPLPNRLLSSAFKASEEAAFVAGLKSRHSSRALQFSIGPTGLMSPTDVPQGLIFNALFENELGEPIPGKVAEQLQIDAQNVIYRTWRYVSWSWQKKRMTSLMSPVLRAVAPVVAMKTMRLEYLDRFSFDGDSVDAAADQLLLDDCEFVSPGVFEAKDQWHSHMGLFLTPPGDRYKRLQQVNVDALDQPDTSNTNRLVRWVNIMTAREDRYSEDGVDDHEINPDIIFEDFDRLHAELKVALRAHPGSLDS